MSYGKIHHTVVPVRSARMSRRSSAVSVIEPLEQRVLLAADAAVSALAPNRAGSLDTTFGTNGVVTTSFGTNLNANVVQALTDQPDGKVLAAGVASSGRDGFPPDFQVPVVRYNTDGSLDTSFGKGGIALLRDGFDVDLALQTDGMILVAANNYDTGNFILYRLTPAGSPDPTFGTGGEVVTDLGGDDRAKAVAVEPDGRIVVGGSSGGNAALVRYMPGGSLDPTFGTDGTLIISSGPGDGAIQAMAIQPDGKIDLVTQPDNFGGYTTGSLLRLNSNGSFDSTFGPGGLVDVGFSTDAVAVLRNGDVVVGGTVVTARGPTPGSNTSEAALQFYQPDGQPDAAVGTAGQVRISFGMPLPQHDNVDTIVGIAQQRDDKIIVAANVGRLFEDTFTHELWGVARFTTTGQLDPTFGTGGISLSQDPGPDFATNNIVGPAIEPDGSIVVAGSPGSENLGNAFTTFTLERYLGDPLASISGTIFNDPTGSGVWQPTDTGLPGRTVYLDLNRNGQFDPGEPSAVTDARGNYTVANLPAGLDYIVRQIVPSGWRQTAPANGFGIHVDLVVGQYAMIAGFEDAASGPFAGYPADISVRPIDAIYFDNGGEGVAYHDTTPQNLGNAGYRVSEGVDINRAPKDYFDSVGYTAPGEWLDYTISVPKSVSYTLQAVVANQGQGGTFHMEIDGVDMTGEMTVPNSGPWDTWVTISSKSFSLVQGVHVMRIQMDQPGVWGNIGDFESLNFAPVPTSTPFLGNPFNVNTIYADEYDKGGEGVAYHTVAPSAHYNLLRGEDNVTLNPGGTNGYSVGYTAPGEWLNYTILAPTSGTYKLEANVANYQQGGTFHMNIDGANVTGTMTVPNTGPWDTWATISSQSFTLSAGRHVMQIQMDTPGYWGNIGDFDWFKFIPA